MMGRSELLAKLEQEASAWDSGSGDIAALLREAKADIEHLAEAAASHFRQAMLNGEAAHEMREDAERYHKWRAAYTDAATCPELDPLLMRLCDARTPDAVDAAIDAAPELGAA